jgi:hypothetical protein
MCSGIRSQVFEEKYFENSHWFLARAANLDFSALPKNKKRPTILNLGLNQVFNNANK